MGSGEDGVIELLSLLDTTPSGGLAVIEELELGLHPEAQARLAQVLVQIALAKNLQIIASSHSAPLIDALPRACRVLVERQGGGLAVTPGPTTRFAQGVFTGLQQAELTVYCEDAVAKAVIEACLPFELRRRIRVHKVGSKDAVASTCTAHPHAAPGQAFVAVLDGDASDADLRKCGGRSTRLPGPQPPERVMVEEATRPEGIQSLARDLACTPQEAQELLAALRPLPIPTTCPIGFPRWQESTNRRLSAP